MYEYLRTHPAVFANPVKKEFNHFNKDLTGGRTGIPDAESYLRYFEAWGEESYALDGSIWYLYSEEAAQQIADSCPDAKIVVMLRDPLQQIPSLHAQRVSSGNEPVDDLEAALALEAERAAGHHVPDDIHVPSGLLYRQVADYAPQLQRFLACFDPEQVHVMIFEDFKADPAAAYTGLLEFLGLPVELPESFAVVNPNDRPRSKTLQTVLKRLRRNRVTRQLVRRALPSQTLRLRLAKRVKMLNAKQVERDAMPDTLRDALVRDMTPAVLATEALLGRTLPWARETTGA